MRNEEKPGRAWLEIDTGRITGACVRLHRMDVTLWRW